MGYKIYHHQNNNDNNDNNDNNNNDNNNNDKDDFLLFRNHTFDTTTEFTLNGKYLTARVIDIYDGDTCTCVLNIFDNFYKFHVRLADIDTCELRTKDEEIKVLSLLARQKLYKLITKSDIDLHVSKKDMKLLLNNTVFLTNIMCGEFDKYGRLLGFLYDYDTNIKIKDKELSYNYTLINEKVAYKYTGQTKMTELEQKSLLENYCPVTAEFIV